MLAGALLFSPLQLLTGGLGLAETAKGQWILRQSWPALLAKVLALDLLLQAACAGAFALLRLRLSAPRCGAAVSLAYLLCLRLSGHLWMEAAPLAAIQAALLYAYARSGSLLVPAAASMMMGAASLYSARMIILLKADLGSLEALPGIPEAQGILTVLGLSAVLYAACGLRRRPWQSLPQAARSPVPLGLLWGVALYLLSYLAYHLVLLLLPAGETVPAMLKQTLLMPLDMLAYIFLIGAALEEVIFRAGLFGAARRRLPGFWPAALLSSAVFSGFHFLDLSRVIAFLGLNVSKLVQSLLMVYSFSWAGFTGRVAAGLLLALLYHRSRTLALPIVAHFTSNMLEAIGLRFGLSWLLTAVAGIFGLLLFTGCAGSRDISRDEPDGRYYRTAAGHDLRVERDGTVLDVTCPPGKSEVLCAGEKAVVVGTAVRAGPGWNMLPFGVAPETGCKPLLRYLSLDPDEESRHSCWHRIWEVPSAIVAYPVVTIVLVGVITSPIWVPVIMLSKR